MVGTFGPWGEPSQQIKTGSSPALISHPHTSTPLRTGSSQSGHACQPVPCLVTLIKLCSSNIVTSSSFQSDSTASWGSVASGPCPFCYPRAKLLPVKRH